MRNIILYGELAKRFGRDHRLSVRTASEAIQAMCVNFPEFKSYMREAHKFGVGFKVFVGNSPLSAVSDTKKPSADSDTLRIAPAIFGSGGWVKILIGAVLIAGGILITPVPGAQAASPFLTKLGAGMVAAGIGMALNGAFELLFPLPKPNMQTGLGGDRQSFMFGGPENTSQQGGPVPLGYGRMMVGSTVISAGIEDLG